MAGGVAELFAPFRAAAAADGGGGGGGGKIGPSLDSRPVNVRWSCWRSIA